MGGPRDLGCEAFLDYAKEFDCQLGLDHKAHPDRLGTVRVRALGQYLLSVFSGFDPTQIPFAANAKAYLDPRFIPYMSFEKVAGLGVSYQTTFLHTRYGIGILSMTKVWNRHTLKVGFEERRSYLNDREDNFPSGRSQFHRRLDGVEPTSATGTTGFRLRFVPAWVARQLQLRQRKERLGGAIRQLCRLCSGRFQDKPPADCGPSVFAGSLRPRKHWFRA